MAIPYMVHDIYADQWSARDKIAKAEIEADAKREDEAWIKRWRNKPSNNA